MALPKDEKRVKPLLDLTSTQIEAIKELFGAAIEMARDDRAAFVDKECNDDRLKYEVLALLDAHDEAAEFFDSFSENVIIPAIGAVASSGDEDPAPSSGVVSHYKIIERIGRGGMGVVYKARDSRLGRTVALKFLPARYSFDASAHARLLAEAKASSALDHPNIGVVFEIGETETKRPFIAMAWYDGETLKQALRRGPLEVDAAVAISRQLCSALAAAHSAGIVHRDVKPANIVVTPNGVVKLLDFGIAKIVQADHPDDGSSLGTPAYMSPEQTRAERTTAVTDIWSLGVVLHEMLAGGRPFSGSTQSAMIESIRNDAAPSVKSIRSDVPLEIASVISKCLEKDPSQRFQSADELLRAIDASVVRKSPSATSSEAYELVLKGRSSWSERTKPKLEEALAFFRAALERDPGLAVAHSAMAETYVNMSNFEYMDVNEALTRAGIAADRAIALDPSLAEAHSSRGFFLASRGRFEEAEESFRKSINLNDHYTWSHHYYALLLIMCGRLTEAEEELRNCLALDPLSLPANTTLAIVLAAERKMTDARAQYQHALALSPEFVLTKHYYGSFEAGQRQFGTAIKSLESALSRAPGFPGVRASLSWCYRETGRPAESDRLMSQLAETTDTPRARVNLALGYGVMGNIERAFELIESESLDVPTTIEMRANPLLDEFRNDGRYGHFLARRGLPVAE
jgi:Serine/threonine protein kinase